MSLTFLANVLQTVMRMGHSDFTLHEAKKSAARAALEKDAAMKKLSDTIDSIEERNEKAYKRVVNGS